MSQILYHCVRHCDCIGDSFVRDLCYTKNLPCRHITPSKWTSSGPCRWVQPVSFQTMVFDGNVCSLEQELDCKEHQLLKYLKQWGHMSPQNIVAMVVTTVYHYLNILLIASKKFKGQTCSSKKFKTVLWNGLC